MTRISCRRRRWEDRVHLSLDAGYVHQEDVCGTWLACRMGRTHSALNLETVRASTAWLMAHGHHMTRILGLIVIASWLTLQSQSARTNLMNNLIGFRIFSNASICTCIRKYQKDSVNQWRTVFWVVTQTWPYFHRFLRVPRVQSNMQFYQLLYNVCSSTGNLQF
jgi:hypothetical protein